MLFQGSSKNPLNWSWLPWRFFQEVVKSSEIHRNSNLKGKFCFWSSARVAMNLRVSIHSCHPTFPVFSRWLALVPYHFCGLQQKVEWGLQDAVGLETGSNWFTAMLVESGYTFQHVFARWSSATGPLNSVVVRGQMPEGVRLILWSWKATPGAEVALVTIEQGHCWWENNVEQWPAPLLITSRYTRRDLGSWWGSSGPQH